MDVLRRLSAGFVAAFMLCAPLLAKDKDSTLIAPDQRIAPVLILASYSMGECSQVKPSFWNRPLLPVPDAWEKRSATYLFCRYLPAAMQAAIAQHDIDVSLRVFDTPVLSKEDYTRQDLAFTQAALDAPENAGRYVLDYEGTFFTAKTHSVLQITLLSPRQADGKRINLGRFVLDETLYVVVDPNTFVNGATLRLRSPMEVAQEIANSLEARCTQTGLFGGAMPCAHRDHLTAPHR